MGLQIGRKGRLYVVQEAGSAGGNGAGYAQLQDGTSASNTLSAAGKAIRHTDFKFTYDPFNRANSPEKKTSPGHVVNLDRRPTAALGSLSALVRPSGVLNTLPEADPIFKAAFGASTNVTLATTVASGAAVGGATLASAGALAIGDPVQIVIASTGKRYIRFITSVAGAVVTWAPNLPVTCAVADTVKGGIAYKLTTSLAISLAFLHCLDGYRRECRGVGIDKLAFNFDANAEPMFTASGPGQKQLNDASAVADPSGFTSVGGNPPSGIIGETYIGNVAYLMKKAGVDISNSLKLRNEEYGSNADSGLASELYRDGRRDVSVSLDAFIETAATLHDLAIAGTNASFFNQTGRTSGNIFGVYAPNVYWHPPDSDSPEGPTSWSFKGTALESADGQNDEVWIGIV